MRHKALYVVLLTLTVSGCAGKMDANRGLSEEWRLRSLEENFLNFKEGQREQEERGREQQRKFLERLRAVEDSVQRLQENQGLAVAPMSQKRAEAAPAPLASAPVVNAQPEPPQSEYVASPAPRPASPSATVDALAERKTGQAPAKPAAKANGGLALSPQYTEGMSLVRDEHPEEGRTILTDFLAAEPGSVLVPNALYWIGESHYQQKNYAQAILTFKDVTRRFPKHHKAAAAMLKIGMSYAMLGEKDNASLYLRALLQDYPKSEPAPEARKKLQELGR